jgi:hypothetical protein
VSPSPEQIEALILQLLARRQAGATICPSEVARDLAPVDWRPLMPSIREVAARMMAAGLIEITQRGEVVDPATARGPVRLSLVQKDEST